MPCRVLRAGAGEERIRPPRGTDHPRRGGAVGNYPHGIVSAHTPTDAPTRTVDRARIALRSDRSRSTLLLTGCRNPPAPSPGTAFRHAQSEPISFRAVRVGIQLPEVERVVRWPEYLNMARAAEEVGFDSIWLGDHLLYEDRGPWEAWTLMAALAAATSRVTIGPLVACAGFHPPGLLAKMAATIDEVSGGRFVLGLGAGWNRREFDGFGIPFDRRVARFEEAFGILRGLLAGEPVTFHGQFHTADRARLLPPPARRVPLMIGSNGPRMLA